MKANETQKSKMRARWHRLAKARREAGLCPQCGKCKPAPRKSRCDWCMEIQNRAKRDEVRRLRAAIIAGYGGRCKCCGEKTPEFLTLDHVNNDGRDHREALGQSKRGGTPMMRWALKNGFPAILQLLCWNCNLAKHLHGVCPHQRVKP